ncbi:MAG: hypothetical protein ACI9BF_000263 [Candidatus Paceibacteria bacterium]
MGEKMSKQNSVYVGKDRRINPQDHTNNKSRRNSLEVPPKYTDEDFGVCSNCAELKFPTRCSVDPVKGLMIGCLLVQGRLAPVQKKIESEKDCHLKTPL